MDYQRFMALLFLANGDRPTHLSNLKDARLASIVEHLGDRRGNPLVEIGAYALMPNHVHFILKEIRDGGIAAFMQKIFTGYTMYFNKKNERTGALLAGTFKSKHLHDDEYFKHAVSYVHLNPAELYETNWKSGVADMHALENRLCAYPYSSLPDFYAASSRRPERFIISSSVFDLYDSIPSFSNVLADAQAYYSEVNIKV